MAVAEEVLAEFRWNNDELAIMVTSDIEVVFRSVPTELVRSVRSVYALRHNIGNEATLGIWRVEGATGSVVLKVLRPPGQNWSGSWSTSDVPSHWNYWRREALAYDTGLVSTAFARTGVKAVDLLLLRDRTDGMTELWLSEAAGIRGFQWSPERLARLSYQLGLGQARWVGNVPSTEWLSCRWMRQYLAQGPARGVQVTNEDWASEFARFWGPRVLEQLKVLWYEQGRFLSALEMVDRTLCHLDMWPANVVDDNGESVLLDWAFVGEGAIGEDIGSLILHSFTDGLMSVDMLPEVAHSSVDGYLDGLRAGGWVGSSDSVRRSIALSGVTKYCWFAPAVLSRSVNGIVDKSVYNNDSSAENAMKRTSALVSLVADWSQVL